MVYHVVSWNFKPELNEEQRNAAGKEIVSLLEALQDKVPALVQIRAFCPPLDGSNCDLVLFAQVPEFSDLPLYQNHPEHQAVVPILNASFCNRRCCDFQL